MRGMASIWKKVNGVTLLQLELKCPHTEDGDHNDEDDDNGDVDDDDDGVDDDCDDCCGVGGGYDCISVAD